jgi:hypothetical protein
LIAGCQISGSISISVIFARVSVENLDLRPFRVQTKIQPAAPDIFLFSHSFPSLKMSSTTPQPSKKHDMYENLTGSIKQARKQFQDFTNAINDVCNQARFLGQSLQTLEDLIPEIVGGEQVSFQGKKPSERKFSDSAHLTDSLVTFSK